MCPGDLDSHRNSRFENRRVPRHEKQLVGHVDNSSCPSIAVDIQMTLVTPANAKGPVPVMMMFGSAAFLNGWPTSSRAGPS